MAITGPSGSGKTTLLHALAGISVPDSGQVRLRTADSSVAVQELSAEERARLRREHFGFVFQQGLLLDERRDPVPLRLCRAPAGRAPVGATTTPSPGCGLRMLYRALSAVGPCILGLPLVQLAGAAAKLSARRRDARLSWLRLLGAGRAMLHALVLLEALLQAAIGLLAGLGIYAALIPALGGLHVDGVRIGAAALVLPWWAIALRVAALLGTAGLAAADDRWQVWFGLHRLGMPVAQIDRARRLAVMRPLRVLLVIVVGATVIVLSPMIGAGALISPMTLAAVVVVLGAGAAMIPIALRATKPALRRRAAGGPAGM